MAYNRRRRKGAAKKAKITKPAEPVAKAPEPEQAPEPEAQEGPVEFVLNGHGGRYYRGDWVTVGARRTGGWTMPAKGDGEIVDIWVDANGPVLKIRPKGAPVRETIKIKGHVIQEEGKRFLARVDWCTPRGKMSAADERKETTA